MKNIKRKVMTIILSIGIVVSGAVPAFAGSISKFDYQNENSFSARYTRAVQAMLMDYSTKTQEKIKKYGVDGSYGPATATAVQIFQGDEDLKPDGSCGPATWGKIDEIKQCWSIGFANGYGYYYFNGKWSKSKCYRQKNSSLYWQCYDGKDWRDVD